MDGRGGGGGEQNQKKNMALRAKTTRTGLQNRGLKPNAIESLPLFVSVLYWPTKQTRDDNRNINDSRETFIHKFSFQVCAFFFSLAEP